MASYHYLLRAVSYNSPYVHSKFSRGKGRNIRKSMWVCVRDINRPTFLRSCKGRGGRRHPWQPTHGPSCRLAPWTPVLIWASSTLLGFSVQKNEALGGGLLVTSEHRLNRRTAITATTSDVTYVSFTPMCTVDVGHGQVCV